MRKGKKGKKASINAVITQIFAKPECVPKGVKAWLIKAVIDDIKKQSGDLKTRKILSIFTWKCRKNLYVICHFIILRALKLLTDTTKNCSLKPESVRRVKLLLCYLIAPFLELHLL
jgi:hypothetical protein